MAVDVKHTLKQSHFVKESNMVYNILGTTTNLHIGMLPIKWATPTKVSALI